MGIFDQQQPAAVAAPAQGAMGANAAPVVTQQTGIAKKPKPIDLLKNTLNASSVQEQFRNALGNNAPTFVASIIDLYNGNTDLQKCAPNQVVMEALKAAVLHLPINKALGFAYIIPFNNSKKMPYVDENGVTRERWEKVYEPVFQLGYKGIIQLAQRSGQYKIINADVVYEGELKSVNKLTGEIDMSGEKTSDRIVGYFAYIEQLNGFHKALYMSVEQMANHAKKFSKGLGKGVTVDSLIATASLPMNDTGAVGWLGNFHGMAIKTVIRNILSKYGCLSIEMENAIASDMRGEKFDTKDNGSDYSGSAPTVVDTDSFAFDDVNATKQIPQAAAPVADEEPGY